MTLSSWGAARHLGTESCRLILKGIRDYLASRIEFRLDTLVSTILVENDKVSGVETEGGDKLHCRYLIIAPGREEADFRKTPLELYLPG